MKTIGLNEKISETGIGISNNTYWNVEKTIRQWQVMIYCLKLPKSYSQTYYNTQYGGKNKSDVGDGITNNTQTLRFCWS